MVSGGSHWCTICYGDMKTCKVATQVSMPLSKMAFHSVPYWSDNPHPSHKYQCHHGTAVSWLGITTGLYTVVHHAPLRIFTHDIVRGCVLTYHVVLVWHVPLTSCIALIQHTFSCTGCMQHVFIVTIKIIAGLQHMTSAQKHVPCDHGNLVGSKCSMRH